MSVYYHCYYYHYLLKVNCDFLMETAVCRQSAACCVMFRGGYLVRPTSVEFWQGQTDRLHDRIVFRRPQPGEVIDPSVTKHGDDGWVYERLCP